jgi:spore maturation protein CgeB
MLRKLLYVAMRYDYGKREQGTSFEFNNFFRTLERIVPTLVEFDFMTILQDSGKEEMNRALLRIADQEAPDLIFFCLFTDEIHPETISTLTKKYITYNWFCDDHWRFSNFSKYFAPHFSFVSTTDREALPKYEGIGYRNALLTQWACNEFDYVFLPDVEKAYPVSFVGQPHGNRRRLIRYLARNRIDVAAFGNGWDRGRVSQEDMIRIFNASLINLNLSNSSWNIRTIFRNQQQIKGRNFEIPGCGGFLLTNYVQNLGEYFSLDNEVVCFSGKQDMLEKIRYYLTHDEERERIARAGYERTRREHTYTRRFKELFARMGFDG